MPGVEQSSALVCWGCISCCLESAPGVWSLVLAFGLLRPCLCQVQLAASPVSAGRFWLRLTLPVSMATSTSLRRCSSRLLVFMDQLSQQLLFQQELFRAVPSWRGEVLPHGNKICPLAGSRCLGAKSPPPLPSYPKPWFFSSPSAGKSSERASYSTFGRDTGMPGLNQVMIKCSEIFCFLYWLPKLRVWY